MSKQTGEVSTSKFIPIQLADYYPPVVIRLLNRVLAEDQRSIVLVGFSENMKWLVRLLQENSVVPILADWREQYFGYDCGGLYVQSLDSVSDNAPMLMVLCVENVNELKTGIKHLYTSDKKHVPTIYDRDQPNRPYKEEAPYNEIALRASDRAKSMISDHQLFDLIQLAEQTSDVPGDVVEYGSLYGGSGAVIAEAVSHYGEKNVWLFDTFEGIPASRYGLDHHWNGSFSDNSFAEVKSAFADMDNVTVVKGNICETYQQVKGAISFGYVASDTLESGEILLNFLWSRLSPGGVIAVCDYGSFPNAIPLTVFSGEFMQDKMNEAFVYRPFEHGLYIIKHRNV